MALNGPDAGMPDFGNGFDCRKDIAFTLPCFLAFPIKAIDYLERDFCRIRHKGIAVKQYIRNVDKMLLQPVSSPEYNIFVHMAGVKRRKILCGLDSLKGYCYASIVQ